MGDKVRPYLFYDVAVSICTKCFQKIEAKIVFMDDKVFMLKHCPQHGNEKVLVADDIDYYRRCREIFIKPPEMPQHYNTPVKWGCPYDCGLCPDTAPQFFRRFDEGGYTIVYRQPQTAEEIASAEVALSGCPTDSIGNDGAE